MKKGSHASRRKMKASIKRRNYRRKVMMSDKIHGQKDRISQLPDDILISIISRLPLRDAIATGVLSSSWRRLYTHADNLVFPEWVFKGNPQKQQDFSNYLKRIDRTLELYRDNHALKEFRLETVDCLEGANLKRWLKFALARRIETLKIELGDGEKPVLPYALRLSKLIETVGRQPLLLGLKSLKELSLCGVRVEDQEFELLLSTFPLLESLSISRSHGTKNILVAGGLKLRKLSLHCVFRFRSIEIRDMNNLVFFECLVTHRYALRISNVPKLTEFKATEMKSKIMHTMPSYIRDQLRQLALCVNPALHTPAYEVKNVKKLKMKYDMQHIFTIIEACSSLETLVVEFIVDEESDEVVPAPSERKQPWSPNLKNLVLSLYVGLPEEVEFAKFVINNVVALEEVSVVPCCNLPPKRRQRAIEYARRELRHDSVNLLVFL